MPTSDACGISCGHTRTRRPPEAAAPGNRQNKCVRTCLALGLGLEPSAQLESSRVSRGGSLAWAASSGVCLPGLEGWVGTCTGPFGGRTLPAAASAPLPCCALVSGVSACARLPARLRLVWVMVSGLRLYLRRARGRLGPSNTDRLALRRLQRVEVLPFAVHPPSIGPLHVGASGFAQQRRRAAPATPLPRPPGLALPPLGRGCRPAPPRWSAGPPLAPPAGPPPGAPGAPPPPPPPPPSPSPGRSTSPRLVRSTCSPSQRR